MRDLGCHPDLFQLAVVKKTNKKNQINKIKREKGRWDKMEKKKKIKRKPGSICWEGGDEKKNRGIITSCSGSVNINNNRNKQRKVF